MKRGSTWTMTGKKTLGCLSLRGRLLKQGLQGWLNMTKIIVGVEEEDNTEVGGLPEDLNPKQKLAYDIICNHIGGVIQDPENTPQLLMNISGAACKEKASGWTLSAAMSKASLSCTRSSSSLPLLLVLQHFSLVARLFMGYCVEEERRLMALEEVTILELEQN
jgi:hypothetical protein